MADLIQAIHLRKDYRPGRDKDKDELDAILDGSTMDRVVSVLDQGDADPVTSGGDLSPLMREFLKENEMMVREVLKSEANLRKVMDPPGSESQHQDIGSETANKDPADETTLRPSSNPSTETTVTTPVPNGDVTAAASPSGGGSNNLWVLTAFRDETTTSPPASDTTTTTTTTSSTTIPSLFDNGWMNSTDPDEGNTVTEFLKSVPVLGPVVEAALEQQQKVKDEAEVVSQGLDPVKEEAQNMLEAAGYIASSVALAGMLLVSANERDELDLPHFTDTHNNVVIRTYLGCRICCPYRSGPSTRRLRWRRTRENGDVGSSV